MREGLLAEKVGMSRFYDKDKINHSVTVLQVRECQVVSLKSFEKDGYNAVTLSHGNYTKSVGKPFKEFLKKNKLKAFSYSREFKLKEPSSFKIGDKVKRIKLYGGSVCRCNIKFHWKRFRRRNEKT